MLLFCKKFSEKFTVLTKMANSFEKKLTLNSVKNFTHFWHISKIWNHCAPETRQQSVDQLSDWKSAVALVSLHQFAGMAISFGLHVDARSLIASFANTIAPL